MTHNLTRAAGCLVGGVHARARAATLRRKLINIPARIIRAYVNSLRRNRFECRHQAMAAT
jgi:hypothetical protein